MSSKSFPCQILTVSQKEACLSEGNTSLSEGPSGHYWISKQLGCLHSVVSGPLVLVGHLPSHNSIALTVCNTPCPIYIPPPLSRNQCQCWHATNWKANCTIVVWLIPTSLVSPPINCLPWCLVTQITPSCILHEQFFHTGHLLSYILKAKKLADSVFQFITIGGNSA